MHRAKSVKADNADTEITVPLIKCSIVTHRQ
nr:MAG TPA: hypothetical protein [Caudoviricetes sp.]DAT54463.1 MAG TPA: hypothetical protein [Caudoviricetes sp.]